MKIILIEDEVEMGSFISRGLKYEGYQVDHISSLQKASERIKQYDYDVMILDLIMPTGTGESLLEDMRKRGDGTPVIVVTAVDNVESKTRLLNMGADDYLVKPFSFIELVARIKSISRRSKGALPKGQVLKIGELTLNPNLKRVARNGKSIRLRAKEYILLEYFMQNPDTVINRNRLIEGVWDYNARLFSNTVDSHISTLRKKINEGFETKLIETVHGFGYILKSK